MVLNSLLTVSAPTVRLHKSKPLSLTRLATSTTWCTLQEISKPSETTRGLKIHRYWPLCKFTLQGIPAQCTRYIFHFTQTLTQSNIGLASALEEDTESTSTVCLFQTQKLYILKSQRFSKIAFLIESTYQQLAFLNHKM